ncbi:MAG TPA: hypothetical protein VKE91_08515 [Blastocatellia bacterium]|nr:hypothetical protein [Blastocatellia bacterium]
MRSKRFTASFLAALLICIPALAQTPAPPQSQKEDKPQKVDKELEKKALALLDELVGEAMSLKLVENRIYALTTAADLFWKRNQDRARALLAEAVNQFMAIEQPSEPDDARSAQMMGIRMELRTQLLQNLAARDSQMALDFLRASRLPDMNMRKMFGGKGGLPDFEQQFEMQLAVRIAETDPRKALQIAEESLKDGVNHQVYEIWANLLDKDPKAAAKLSGEIISAFKSSDLMKGYPQIYVVSSMLSQLRAQMQPSRSATKDSQSSQPPPASQEMREMFRELLELVVSTALKVTTAQLLNFNEQDQARNVLTQVQQFLPDIEKYLPSRASAVRAKLAQFDKAFYRQPVPPAPFEEMENKSADELIEMADKSQVEFKSMFYHQAATKFIEQGDTERARQIAKDFLSPLDPLMTEIEQKERERALVEGKLEEARKSISRLSSSEERAQALVELAKKAEAKKDQKSQQELLKEAGALLGDQMETRAQVEAQLGLAAASLNVDADHGFEILGSAIDRLNVVLNAVVTITKFDQNGGLNGRGVSNAMDGEMRLNAGEFGNITTNLDRQILAFARKDFDRTVTLLRRWQVDEVRLAMCLMLLDRILGEEKETRFYQPFGFSERGR